MGEEHGIIRAWLARAASTLPSLHRADAGMARRVEWLIAEGEGILASDPQGTRVYELWIALTTVLHELERKGYLPTTVPAPPPPMPSASAVADAGGAMPIAQPKMPEEPPPEAVEVPILDIRSIDSDQEIKR